MYSSVLRLGLDSKVVTLIVLRLRLSSCFTRSVSKIGGPVFEYSDNITPDFLLCVY